MNQSFNSDIHIQKPVYVRITDYPRSLLARAINYCYVFQQNSKNVAVYSQFLKNSKKTMDLKDVIEADNLSLEIDLDFIVNTDIDKIPKKINKDSIFIICETNDGLITVPKKYVSLFETN